MNSEWPALVIAIAIMALVAGLIAIAPKVFAIFKLLFYGVGWN